MQTELILLAKVEGLGAESDVVKVRPGYARNHLLPKGLAVPATALHKQAVESLKQKRAEREANELNAANDISRKIAKMTLTFQMQPVEDQPDKVYGSVAVHDLITRLEKEGVVLEKHMLKLAHPLKEIGEHEVPVHLHADVNATLKVVLALPKEVIEAREKAAADAAAAEAAGEKGRPKRAPRKKEKSAE
jgi:large subunit ribosomal protein L9